jgi:hypothetical protein
MSAVAIGVPLAPAVAVATGTNVASTASSAVERARNFNRFIWVLHGYAGLVMQEKVVRNEMINLGKWQFSG